MPLASIIVPSFNVADTIAETLTSLCAQSYGDFEIIVVNDGSTDTTLDVVEPFRTDPRVHVLTQRNRGLAGARNSGIAAARGAFIGFCDADDIWAPEKLATHVTHLLASPDVGVSYSGSRLIDDAGADLGLAQRPRLLDVTAAHILKRNPVGNGSAPVIRRDVFDAIAYRPHSERHRDWYFDETFRQSEDIECWMRIALTTDWMFEGVTGLLTAYRINANGLSAATDAQLAAWEKMISKLSALHPAFFARHTKTARSYQYRYLARRAVSDRNAHRALEMTRASLAQSMRPLLEEPRKTLTTLCAAMTLHCAGPAALDVLMQKKENNT
ncbi:glycosyltransferase family 2 protein [Pseudooctadecabacter jejudonensis]|uniref:Putative glycosyltransferase EpsJ n=1 Tax=Pseudooctadecabacter jejudonensis TaxID=1391910 RepID=A0A1Y5RXG9_9RHOB|nr:glycosyltransferase family A protein [Pseudooctadecabacter jejudonensis]SLN27595.1 putative glycosyltransferase EpsJ [Pseudooctadecabacter jejudonensis]